MGKTGKTFVSDRLSGLSPDQANHSKGVVFSRRPEGVMFTEYVSKLLTCKIGWFCGQLANAVHARMHLEHFAMLKCAVYRTYKEA